MKKTLLLVVFLFAASSMVAQSIAVGPMVSYVKGKDASEGTFQYGVSARLSFLFLGVEGTAGYSQTTFNSAAKLTTYPVSVSAMFNVLPFIYASAGIDFWFNKLKVDIPGVGSMEDNSTTKGFHIGVGAQISVGSISIFGDARYLFLDKIKYSNGEFNNDGFFLGAGILFKL